MLIAGDLRNYFRDCIIDGNQDLPREMYGLMPIILNTILRKSVLSSLVILSTNYYRARRGE